MSGVFSLLPWVSAIAVSEKFECDCGCGDTVYDWRRPADRKSAGPNTPVSFRWRFNAAGDLVTFCAYGWTQRTDHRGRKIAEYGILSKPERDTAAEALRE